MRRVVIFLGLVGLGCAWVAMCPDLAFASGDMLDTFQSKFISAAKGGLGTLSGYALGLVGSLIIIEFVMVVSKWGLEGRGDLGDTLWKFIKWGLFIYIIKEYPSLVDSARTGFLGLSESICGGTDAMLNNPSLFTTTGSSMTEPLFESAKNIELTLTGSVLALFMLFCIGCIWFLYFLLALSVVSANIVFYLCAAIGYCFIPFFMLAQTRILAGTGHTALLAGSVRLLTLNCVIVLGNKIIVANLIPLPKEAGINALGDIFTNLGYIGLFALLALKLPSIVSSSVVGQAGGGVGLTGAAAQVAIAPLRR